MTKNKRKEVSKEGDVDMTPMLDIVFILLIFFIVTTSFIKEEGFLVNRPEAKKINSIDPVVLIQIADSGSIKINNKYVDIERLPARIESFLAKYNTNSAVVIPNFNTKHSDVVAVLDKIKLFKTLTISISK